MSHRHARTSVPATILVSATLLLAAFAIAAAPANAASCKAVSVDRGGHGGEEGAYAIRAKGLSCKSARRVVRLYLLRGDAPRNWALRTETRSFLLYSGRRNIRFRAAS